MLALLLSVACACALPTAPTRADEPGSGRVSGAGTSKVSPRWPLASLASAAAADRLDEIKARGNLVLGTCYKAPPYFESRRAAAIAMKKGETGLRDAVNRALLGLEASGQAAYIYDAWFGPKSENPLPRAFRIQRE